MFEISDEKYKELRLILEKQSCREYTLEEAKEVGNALIDLYNLLMSLLEGMIPQPTIAGVLSLLVPGLFNIAHFYPFFASAVAFQGLNLLLIIYWQRKPLFIRAAIVDSSVSNKISGASIKSTVRPTF